MCGILGIVNFNQLRTDDIYGRFEKGLGLMHGRGPNGYWVYSDADVLMGQTLLAVTDPNGSAAPYISNDKNIIACANGEIFNHLALRQQLENLGASFRSNADCEVIAHGYAYWGEKVFERLDGMFAAAIFDRQRRKFTLIRDKVGIRPLYYTEQMGYMAFASEPRLLTSSGLASNTPSDEALFHALVLRRPLEPLTMYKEIQAVLPGAFMSWHATHIDSISRFFAHMPSQALQNGRKDNPPADLDMLHQAIGYEVSQQIPRQSKYSLFLSGGLDSTIINYLTPPQPQHRLPSMVCGFSFANMVDERLQAEQAARVVNTQLISRSVDLDQFIALWAFMVWIHSEPLMFNSSVPLFMLCREARDLGAKVMLSGEGADEMFVGYSQYPAYKEYKDDGHPEYLFQYDDEIIDPDLVLAEWVIDKEWGKKQRQQLQNRIDALLPFKGEKHGLARKLEFDRMTFMRGLLMRQDRVGLTASIEIRVPFLGSGVLHQATQYSTPYHIPNDMGKYLLREAFAPYITPELAKTPKIGFPVPLNIWLMEPKFKAICLKLNEVLNQNHLVQPDAILTIITHSNSYPQNSYRQVWTLLNLAMWWLTRDAPPPPHGVWATILPPELHAYVANIVAETKHAPESGFIFNHQTLSRYNTPTILYTNNWHDKPQVANWFNFPVS